MLPSHIPCPSEYRKGDEKDPASPFFDGDDEPYVPEDSEIKNYYNDAYSVVSMILRKCQSEDDEVYIGIFFSIKEMDDIPDYDVIDDSQENVFSSLQEAIEFGKKRLEETGQSQNVYSWTDGNWKVDIIKEGIIDENCIPLPSDSANSRAVELFNKKIHEEAEVFATTAGPWWGKD